MFDGHVNKCKECNKKDVRERSQHPDRIETLRKYEAKRFKEKKRREYVLAQGRKYNKNNRFKRNARQKARRALLSGKLIKQPCEICSSKNVEMHHDDYAKPLDARWFCQKHHKEHDRTYD